MADWPTHRARRVTRRAQKRWADRQRQRERDEARRRGIKPNGTSVTSAPQ